MSGCVATRRSGTFHNMESSSLTKALGLLEATAGHPAGRPLADLAAETARIRALIEEEFESIETEPGT